MSACERLLELLDYIEQVEKLKRKATFVVPDEFFRAFQVEMQGLPGLEFNQLSAGDDVWLRVPIRMSQKLKSAVVIIKYLRRQLFATSWAS